MLAVTLTFLFTFLFKISFQTDVSFTWIDLPSKDKEDMDKIKTDTNWHLKQVTWIDYLIEELFIALPATSVLNSSDRIEIMKKILRTYFLKLNQLHKFIKKESINTLNNNDIKLIAENFAKLFNISQIEMAAEFVRDTKFSTKFKFCTQEEFFVKAAAAKLENLDYKKFATLQGISLEGYLQALSENGLKRCKIVDFNNDTSNEESLCHLIINKTLDNISISSTSIFDPIEPIIKEIETKNAPKEPIIEKLLQSAMQPTNSKIVDEKKEETNGALAVLERSSVLACLTTVAFLLF